MAELTKLKAFEQSDIEDVKILIKVKGNHYTLVPQEDKAQHCLNQRVLFVGELLKTHNVVGVPLEKLSPKKVLNNMQSAKQKREGLYASKKVKEAKRIELDTLQELKQRWAANISPYDAAAIAILKLDMEGHLMVYPHHQQELEEYTKIKFKLD